MSGGFVHRSLTVAALIAASAWGQQVKAVRFAKLWDGEKVIDRPLVLIENGRIKSVQAGDPAPPAGAEVVDWSRYYGLPGLIDVHTHMTYISEGPGITRGGQRMAAVTVFLAQENARKTLETGVDAAHEFGFRPGAIGPLNTFIARNLETAKRAWKAGVPFAMGSDAVYTMFGQNTRELGWFVKTGMTPEQALRTATVNAADLLGMRDDLGAATPGHFADLVAVEGDPLTDIQVAIGQVRGVMKGGTVVVKR